MDEETKVITGDNLNRTDDCNRYNTESGMNTQNRVTGRGKALVK
jgi:hypothetical protein